MNYVNDVLVPIRNMLFFNPSIELISDIWKLIGFIMPSVCWVSCSFKNFASCDALCPCYLLLRSWVFTILFLSIYIKPIPCRLTFLRWMNSHTSSLHLDGFFLRLRLGKWEEDIGGTGYHVACITGMSIISSNMCYCLWITDEGSDFPFPMDEGSVLLQLIANVQFSRIVHLSLFSPSGINRGTKRKITTRFQKTNLGKHRGNKMLGWNSIYLESRFPWGQFLVIGLSCTFWTPDICLRFSSS